MLSPKIAGNFTSAFKLAETKKKTKNVRIEKFRVMI
jgi:hypothetical protein